MVAVAQEKIRRESLEKTVRIHQMGVAGMDGFPESYCDAVVSTLAFSELSDDERHFALEHSARKSAARHECLAARGRLQGGECVVCGRG